MHENRWFFDVSEIPGTNGSHFGMFSQKTGTLDPEFLKNRNLRLLKSNSHTTLVFTLWNRPRKNPPEGTAASPAFRDGTGLVGT